MKSDTAGARLFERIRASHSVRRTDRNEMRLIKCWTPAQTRNQDPLPMAGSLAKQIPLGDWNSRVK